MSADHEMYCYSTVTCCPCPSVEQNTGERYTDISMLNSNQKQNGEKNKEISKEDGN